MTQTSIYSIKTPVFEGPLELLLDLIESRKLLINEISLAAVADDYVAYIKRFDRLPVGDVAHFILVASTLLLIKSKSLLPTLDLTPDEAGNIKELERRLMLYQEIRSLSRHVSERYGVTILFPPAHRGLSETPLFTPGRITTEIIRDAVRRVLETVPEDPTLPQVMVREVVSIEEMIDRLSERVKKELQTSFREFSGMGKSQKVDIIVSFLALLELVKQGAIGVRQDRHFDDIAMEREQVEIPHY